jgi:hypothetical protein
VGHKEWKRNGVSGPGAARRVRDTATLPMQRAVCEAVRDLTRDDFDGIANVISQGGDVNGAVRTHFDIFTSVSTAW